MDSRKAKFLTAACTVLLLLACVSHTAMAKQLVDILAGKATQFSDDADVGALLEHIRDQRLVLLGESTHGTSQYYSMRAEISTRLINEHDFSFIAVEGDWASIYRLNLYVKGLWDNQDDTAEDIMQSFERWPAWMWSNRETARLVEWIRQHNAGRDPDDMVGFYGIDVYGQWDAMDRLLEYARQRLPEEYDSLRAQAECFSAFGKDEWAYARAVHTGHASCAAPLSELLRTLEQNRKTLAQKNSRTYFQALQNAHVLKNAKEYYRLAVLSGPGGWNSRARHFHDTVNRLLDHYGKDSRGIVWAHNTHVGDARATSMGDHGMVNIGRLAREVHGEDAVFIVGFATYAGQVLAGRSWGAPMEKMSIPEAMPSSLEHALSMVGHDRFFLVFSTDHGPGHVLMQPVGHRAVGVVYNPRDERGNYVPTILPARYDALVFLMHTDVLEAL